jgi:retron-type reverse transcriptase
MKTEHRSSCENSSKNILNKCLPDIFKQINIHKLESYKSFFILKNLKKKNNKFRYLLKNVISEPLFLIYAYRTIQNTLGDMTLCDLTSKTALNNIDINWFINLSKKLKKNKFNWGFSPWSYTSKKLNSEKPFYINSPKNKIIQKAIYLVLLEIYENKLNYFSNHSHGFRPNKNCHSALHEIKFGWQNISWYLEFNIKKAFNSLKIDKLIELLKADIQDQTFFSLLQKMFKIKTQNKKKVNKHKNSVTQENVLLPLLLNIYLTPLDKYAGNLIKLYSLGKRPERNHEHNKLVSLTKEKELKLTSYEAELKLEQLKRVYQKTSKFVYDESFTKIKYVRYVDDFIFGVLGKKKLAVRIKKEITNYIQNNLSLDVDGNKTKLTNVFKDSISFLSCKIYCTKRKYLSFSKPKAIEKRLKIMRRIKIKKKITINKNLKKSADNI